MAEQTLPLQLDLATGPLPQRRGARVSKNGKPIGRPPGSHGRRSVDLARYIEATFAGMTPGQQAAQLAMVTPKELKRAKDQARELGLLDLGLSELMLALVVKAARLAAALGCDRKEAWLLMQREREALLPYIHQKRPAAAEEKAGQKVYAYLMPDDGGAQSGSDPTPDLSIDGDDEGLEILGVSPADPGQVSRPKSHGDT